MRSRTLLAKMGLTAVLICISIIFIFPFYWMLVSSFRDLGEIFTQKLTLLPKNPQLTNYVRLVTEKPFFRWYLNSLIFVVGYVAIGVFICSLGGYAFAKYRFRFQNFLFLLIIIGHMLPVHMQLIPLFIILTKTKLINTYTGLILPMTPNPMGIFLVRQYMVGLDDSLIDSARIDGASEWRIFFKIIMPVSRPVIAALAILLALFAWNDLLWPLTVMRTENMFTLSVGLASMIGLYRPEYGLVMAGSTLSVLPIVIFFLFMQRHFITGITAGSVKG
jgi:lactose/L-arabinose transport system permease protein